jgi:prepilin-type N-terminal cleavage/methylation domain-containing protein
MWHRHETPPGSGRACLRTAGFTLVELVVAMGLFAVLLAVLMSAIIGMIGNLRKTQGIADASGQARVAFDRLDRQLRYATAVNRPVLVGQDWYLEFTTLDTAGQVGCRQWRVGGATDLLQQRAWTGAPVTPPSWAGVATGVVNNPASQPPFTFVAADAQHPTQQVTVDLVLTRGANPPGHAETRSTLVARNTDTTTATNADANGDGVSDQQVCQEVARS